MTASRKSEAQSRQQEPTEERARFRGFSTWRTPSHLLSPRSEREGQLPPKMAQRETEHRAHQAMGDRGRAQQPRRNFGVEKGKPRGIWGYEEGSRLVEEIHPGPWWLYLAVILKGIHPHSELLRLRELEAF